MLVLTVGSFSVFGEIFEMTVNYQSDLAFWGFPSFLFSLYRLLIYWGVGYRWRPGPCVVSRGVVLSVGALSNMSGFCIVCWGFV